MKEIRIFLASSYELEPDRARIGNLIRRLNDAYEERFIHLHLVKWEDTDSFYNQSSKQLEYDYLIRQCELFVGLFWHRAGKHTVHEVEVARGSMRPENILVFKKNAPFRADHEGSEDVRRFLEKFPDEVLKDSEAELCKFLEKQDSFFPYDTFAELEKVLSEKLKDYCASLTVTEEEKARTYSGNTLQIHVAASPEVEPDMARLGDLVRYLDENSKQYCRIKMIDVLPGSDMFVSMCHTSAPADLRKVIDSAIRENENSGKRGKPRLYFCMKYLGKDDKKDQSLEALEDEFRNTLSHYPDRYTHAPEMKLHFMLQLERLQRETVFSEPMFVVKDGVICMKTSEKKNPCPLISCEDMLKKDSSYQMLLARRMELEKELEELNKQEPDHNPTNELDSCIESLTVVIKQINSKQYGLLNLARKLEEMVGQEQDRTMTTVRLLFQCGRMDEALALLPTEDYFSRDLEDISARVKRSYEMCLLKIKIYMDIGSTSYEKEIRRHFEYLFKYAAYISEEKAADAFWEYAEYLARCGLNDEALEYYRKVLEKRIRIFGEEHESVAENNNRIGTVLYNKGNYDKALEYYEKALSIRLHSFDAASPDIAENYNRIGSVWSDKGIYDKALEYYNMSLSIRLRSLGEEHPDVASSYNNIGNVCSQICKYSEALVYYEKALSIRLRVLGEEHPDVADSYNNIGTIRLFMIDYDDAREYYIKALSIRLRTLGEEHPDVADSYNNIGYMWYQKGDDDNALEYYDKALSIRLRVFGEEHPDVANSYFYIGSIWNNNGNYDKALAFYKKTLSIRLRVLGEEHPDVANSYFYIGSIWNNKGSYDKASEYFDKACFIARNFPKNKICRQILGYFQDSE